ncbi:MAG: FtsX-like permease family protein [Candidatus Acidiferrales bacterium]
MKPGVSRERAAARLNVIGKQIQRTTGPQMTERDLFLLRDGRQGFESKQEQFGRPVLLLMLLVAVVLLVACANLAALLLVRSVERAREAGVRLALGASRAAVVRQFLTESLMLAVAGGVAGWGLAHVLVNVLLNLLGPQGVGLARHVQADWNVFTFSAALTLAAGALFGALPAWRASRIDPLSAIRGVARGLSSRTSLSRTLIAGQVALSLALLFGAGLFAKSLRNLRAIDLGLQPENVVLMHIDLTGSARGGAAAGQFFQELLERARAMPETRMASLANLSVLSGAMQSTVVRLPDHVPNRLMPVTNFVSATSGYFRTLGIPVLAGRDFTSVDHPGTSGEGTAIVNEQFAIAYLGGEALDKVFGYGGGRKVRVAGIAGTARFRYLREEPQPVMYLPVNREQFPQSLHLQVRTSADPVAMMGRLRGLVREMDARLPLDRITTMEMQIDQALSRERMLAFLSTALGGVALALAAIGIYGALSFSVARRTREIGIRTAVGAPRGRIAGLFVGDSARTVAAGIAAGIPLALGCGKLASTLLYGLEPQDAGTATAATALLIAATLAAALLPAWRAARLDAMKALRHD